MDCVSSCKLSQKDDLVHKNFHRKCGGACGRSRWELKLTSLVEADGEWGKYKKVWNLENWKNLGLRREIQQKQ